MDQLSIDDEPQAEQVRNQGKVTIKGEITGRYHWNNYCIGSFEFCTNGPRGGDAGHGGFLRLQFNNAGGFYMEVAVDGQPPATADTVTLTFRGDADMAAAIEALEFMLSKLKVLRPLLR